LKSRRSRLQPGPWPRKAFLRKAPDAQQNLPASYLQITARDFLRIWTNDPGQQEQRATRFIKAGKWCKRHKRGLNLKALSGLMCMLQLHWSQRRLGTLTPLKGFGAPPHSLPPERRACPLKVTLGNAYCKKEEAAEYLTRDLPSPPFPSITAAAQPQRHHTQLQKHRITESPRLEETSKITLSNL